MRLRRGRNCLGSHQLSINTYPQRATRRICPACFRARPKQPLLRVRSQSHAGASCTEGADVFSLCFKCRSKNAITRLRTSSESGLPHHFSRPNVCPAPFTAMLSFSTPASSNAAFILCICPMSTMSVPLLVPYSNGEQLDSRDYRREISLFFNHWGKVSVIDKNRSYGCPV